jgi:hypothetical protein
MSDDHIISIDEGQVLGLWRKMKTVAGDSAPVENLRFGLVQMCNIQGINDWKGAEEQLAIGAKCHLFYRLLIFGKPFRSKRVQSFPIDDGDTACLRRGREPCTCEPISLAQCKQMSIG